ncbi:MAG: hypothetical protein NC397_07575 [Clostridium sp.]|nr:hypothetical protein [Clostridium sp.]
MMNENNFKIKATAKEKSIMPSGQTTFNQHKFISDIYECEKQKYIIDKRIKMINHEISNTLYIKKYNDTEFAKYENKNIKHIKHEQRLEIRNGEVDSFGERFGMYVLFGGIAGIVVGLGKNILNFLGITGYNHNDSFIKKFIAPGFRAMLITFAIVLVIMAIDFIRASAADRKKINSIKQFNKSVPEKNKEIEEFNKKLKKDCNDKYLDYVKKRRAEIDRIVPYMRQEKEEAKKQLDYVNNTLQSLYNLRIDGVLCLHPNYQGLVPISIIYGYFDTGRCTQLQGHEGAYNLYEDEKMKGMIINKLDVVSRQLSQLNNTMLYVGQAIEECNSRLSDLESASNRMIGSINNMNSNVSKQLSGISNQMSAIEANTANSAYYSEIGARMTTFNTVYNLLKD